MILTQNYKVQLMNNSTQLSRRQSIIKKSQHPSDYQGKLTNLVVDELDKSTNLMQLDDQIYKCFTDAETLSPKFIELLGKLIQKEVLIIGMILPSQLLQQCFKMLTNKKQANFSSSDLNCTMITNDSETGLITLLLSMNEQHLTGQQKIKQTVLLGLSLVLVTSQQYAKRLNKKQNIDRKMDRFKNRQLVMMNPGLMIIKNQEIEIEQYLLRGLQNKYWNVEVINHDQLFNKIVKHRKKSIKESSWKANRQGYQGLAEEQEEIYEFAFKLQEVSVISLKRNWKISKGIMCYPFLYYLSLWVKQEKDPKIMIQNALSAYCKALQQKYMKMINSVDLPVDQLFLRKQFNYKKLELLMKGRRNFAMFQNLFPLQEMASKRIQQLSKTFNQKQNDLYHKNNIKAAQYNQNILIQLYTQIIMGHFKKQESTEDPVQKHSKKFCELLQSYGNKSVRVSSQLKTFNDFIKNKKMEYADCLSKSLRNGKKKYTSQKQQLMDRLQIQTGVLQTLELQINELQEKRIRMEEQNSKLKHTIDSVNQKRISKVKNDSPSKSSKKVIELSDKTSKKQSKKQHKTTKIQAKKQSKCCCSVM